MNDITRRKANADSEWLLRQCTARLVLAFGDTQADEVPLSVVYDDAECISPFVVRVGWMGGETLDYRGSCRQAALAFFVSQGIPLIRKRFEVITRIHRGNGR